MKHEAALQTRFRRFSHRWRCVARGYPGQGVTSNLTCGGPGPGGVCYNAAGSQCVAGAAARGPGAQQFGVFPINKAPYSQTYSSNSTETDFMYVGIRYGSSPDGNKCHEFQYWAPLQFDDEGHAKPMVFEPEVHFDLPSAG